VNLLLNMTAMHHACSVLLLTFTLCCGANYVYIQVPCLEAYLASYHTRGKHDNIHIDSWVAKEILV